MSYAKDLVVAGKIDIKIMFPTAEEMLAWVENKPVPQPQGGDPNPEYEENPHPIDDGDPIPF